LFRTGKQQKNRFLPKKDIFLSDFKNHLMYTKNPKTTIYIWDINKYFTTDQDIKITALFPVPGSLW